MKTISRAALASIALTVLFASAPAAKAQDLCIPLLTCPTGGGGTSSAPEISGSMLSTGLGLVTGVGIMIRNRRRSSK